MDCSAAGVGALGLGKLREGGDSRRGDDREGKGKACVSGDVTGSRRGIVWEGDRFVRSVYPRVFSPCCVNRQGIGNRKGLRRVGPADD